MATLRTIQSPGVQITETDLSQTLNIPTGTNVLVAGFAPQGPTYEVVTLASLADFQTVFGTPTNAAERYFYYSVSQLFTAGGSPTIQAVRIPYGGDTGDGTASNYGALAFPVVVVPQNPVLYNAAAALANAIPLSSAAGYYFGEPALVCLSPEQYQTVSQGGINWATTTGNIGVSSFVLSGTGVVNSLSAAGMVIVNDSQATLNETFKGYYLNIADSLTNNPATDFDDAVYAKGINSSYFQANANASDASYTYLPNTILGFNLSAAYTANIQSVSQDIENVPTFNIAASGLGDNIILSLFRLRPSPFSPNTTTLQYVLQEGYVGSLYAGRQQQSSSGGPAQSLYLQTVVNNRSKNVQVFVNPNISTYVNWLDPNGNTTKRVRMYKTDTNYNIANAALTSPDYTFYTVASTYLQQGAINGAFLPVNNLYAFGTYADSIPLNSSKTIGNLANKVNYMLNIAMNPDITPIDISIDAGLSTIFASTQALGTTEFDDTNTGGGTLLTLVNQLTSSNGNPVSNTLINAWTTITSQFQQFAQYQRKDHYFISDPLRYIFVTGIDYKTLNNVQNNFSQNIYWPLRNSYTGINSSYAVAYGNWVQATDIFTSQSVWLPFSGFAAAMTTASDANNYVWTAPAGLNRGIITGITDIGVNPLQKQRDLLYNISVNPVVYFPGTGYTVFGQKTLLTTPSAFSRINVRRLFLFLEKATNSTVKYFVFEPNTTFTQSRVVNTLTPLFDIAKNTQGLYDYLIVCNSSNNGSSIVDQNELVVDIYLKPVRTAEYILVNFYASQTSQDFNELIS